MNDQNNPEHSSSRRFVKGVHRASFSPVDADESYVAPPSPAPTPVSPAPAVAAMPVSIPKPKKKSPFAKIFFFMILGCAIAGASGYSFYMYWNSQKQLNALRIASPEKYIQLQDQSLVDRVRRHMDLPAEQPFITTIADADSLRNQLFYAKAQNEDKVLVFSERAILYRPSDDKVIEVGFIRPATPTPLAGEASSSAVAGAATSSGRILLQNEKK